MLDQLRRPRVGSQHDWAARSESFCEYNPERLIPAHQGERIGPDHLLQHLAVRENSQKMNTTAQTRSLNSSLDLGSRRAITRDAQLDLLLISGCFGESFDQAREAFTLVEHSGAENNQLSTTFFRPRRRQDLLGNGIGAVVESTCPRKWELFLKRLFHAP